MTNSLEIRWWSKAALQNLIKISNKKTFWTKSSLTENFLKIMRCHGNRFNKNYDSCKTPFIGNKC